MDSKYKNYNLKYAIETHKALCYMSADRGVTLRSLIEEAIERFIAMESACLKDNCSCRKK